MRRSRWRKSLLPFAALFFHIYDSNSLILYPGYYSGINNSPEKHQISLMLLNDIYVVVQFFLWVKFCSKLITIPQNKGKYT